MARFLIRQAHGGQTLTIDDGAWPYFQNQDYVIVSVLEDDGSSMDSVYLSAAESDFRYVRLGDIADDASTGGTELRTFFEQKIDRTGASTGDVPELQADGTLAFGAGGGGSGTVTSVNSVTPTSGDVALTLDDITDGTEYVRITAAEYAQLQVLLSYGIVWIKHEGGVDPTRPATTLRVFWEVPDGNRPATDGTTAGGTYAAVDGLDRIETF